ncbi:MAG: LapA family protein [Alphaproteobacteria bacterium]
MALLRWIAGFLLILCAGTFAVFNRTRVDVIWNPVEEPFSLPLYAVGLGALALGFLAGGVCVWVNMGSLRREKRRQKKDIKRLEKALAESADCESGYENDGDTHPAVPHALLSAPAIER